MSQYTYVESGDSSDDYDMDIESSDQSSRYARSTAPSPIDTGAQQLGRVMAFQVRDFEDRYAPLMFLDSYIQKFKGWPNIRCLLTCSPGVLT